MRLPVDLPLPGPLLSRLRQPALYRQNPTFRNPAWTDAPLRLLIARLSPYEDVSQSYSHLFLAQEARRASASAYIDLAFLPGKRDRRVLREGGAPPLFGTQSHMPGNCFDVILVSWAYVLEIVNLPWLLTGSDIPLYASERTGPLVLVGGSAALACPLLVGDSGRSIPDALFFGEGERRVEEIVRGLAGPPADGASCDHAAQDHGAWNHGGRKAWLAAAAGSVDGLWVPGTGGTGAAGLGPPAIPAARCVEPRSRDLAIDYPVLPGSEASTGRLQISYGCRYACAFCLEGQSRRPYREVPEDDIIRAALDLKRRAGVTRIELGSYNFSSHSRIGPVLLALNERFDAVGAMSQRPDELCRRDGLADLEIAAEKRSFTLGIEGISERLRRFLNKGVTAKDATCALSLLIARRVREVKLFYIVTGHENDANLVEFDEFCGWLRTERNAAGGRTRVVFSANRLVRMPFTPLEHDPVCLDRERLDAILRRVRTAVQGCGMEMRDPEPWDDYLAEQALASGLPGLHETMIALAERGVVFDGKMPKEAAGELAAVFRAAVARTAAGPGSRLVIVPSLVVRAGPDPDARLAAYDRLRALLGEQRPLSQPAPGAVPAPIPRTTIARLDETVRSRRALRPRFFLATLPPEVAGMGSEWLAAWLCRSLLHDVPALAEQLVRCREVLWGSRWGEQVAWHGATVVGITARAGDRDILGPAGRPAWIASECPGFTGDAPISAAVVLRVPLADVERPEEALGRFLVDAHAPATVRKDADGWYGLDTGSRARKAGVVLGGRYGREADRFVAELEIGRRFDAAQLIQTLGGERHGPDARYSATVEVRRLDAGARRQEEGQR